jgi:hypothetical protein
MSRYFSFVGIFFLCLFFSHARLSAYEIHDEEYLGEYQEIYDILEKTVEEDELLKDDVFCRTNGFISKCSKKLNRFYLKQVKKMISKLLNPQVLEDPERMCYEIAHFKRKIDKVYNIGPIDTCFFMINKMTEDKLYHPHIKHMTSRIKFYYENRDVRVQKINKKMDVCQGVLDIIDNMDIQVGIEIPPEVNFALGEMLIGGIIFIIPIPGATTVGAFFFIRGCNDMAEYAKREYCDKHRKYSIFYRSNDLDILRPLPYR